MSKEKFIVICGSVLKDHDSQILNLIDESFIFLCTDDQGSVNLKTLPEQSLGASGVRQLVSDVIKANIPTVFVTRYEHTVSEFANAVARGDISRENVVFKLVRYEDDDMDKFYVTEHQIDETNERLDSKWPMGILW